MSIRRSTLSPVKWSMICVIDVWRRISLPILNYTLIQSDALFSRCLANIICHQFQYVSNGLLLRGFTTCPCGESKKYKGYVAILIINVVMVIADALMRRCINVINISWNILRPDLLNARSQMSYSWISAFNNQGFLWDIVQSDSSR